MDQNAVAAMSPQWRDALVRAAGLPPATGWVVLGGGTFSSVFRVATRDGDVIVKVPPDPGSPLMTYEHGITATEGLYYRLAAAHGITAVPQALYHGQVGGVEALVLSVCPGQPWPAVADRLTDDQRRVLRRRVGREVAALHRIVGSGFGYPARPLVPTWRAAFLDMITMMLADATRFGVPLPRDPADIVAIIERVSPVLDEVTTATLVHFDLWDGNILVGLDADPARPRLGGLIDAERAFWGDAAWLAQAYEWIDARLGELGHERTGPIEQPHVYPWSTVLRSYRCRRKAKMITAWAPWPRMAGTSPKWTLSRTGRERRGTDRRPAPTWPVMPVHGPRHRP
ncbi:MAG: aminoglycoside phosphotransferase family protein [Micromonosporaceae bacterium]|nr:aminoglycoside phosphotransferase family protein [Micromonosporaceae bacterium]